MLFLSLLCSTSKLVGMSTREVGYLETLSGLWKSAVCRQQPMTTCPLRVTTSLVKLKISNSLPLGISTWNNRQRHRMSGLIHKSFGMPSSLADPVQPSQAVKEVAVSLPWFSRERFVGAFVTGRSCTAGRGIYSQVLKYTTHLLLRGFDTSTSEPTLRRAAKAMSN